MQTEITVRTSQTHPLEIATVKASGEGTIGMTLCPGKHQKDAAFGGDWKRDLDADLAVIKEWGASAVLTLMEEHELKRYRVPGIANAVRNLGMQWYHAPIEDGDVPGTEFGEAWPSIGPNLRRRLSEGDKVLVHCRAGLGRTGMIAARLLVEMGVPAATAVRQVRNARPGAIETDEQKDHVLSIENLNEPR